jgi:hypothetical protein
MYPDLDPPEPIDYDEPDILDRADVEYEEWRDRQDIEE